MSNLVTISGRRVILTPFLKSEIELMLSWRNSVDYQNLCSHRRYNVDLEQFKKELSQDFSQDRHEQYIIRKSDMTPIGTIFSYDYNRNDEYLYVTTYLSEEYKSSVYGVEAHTLMLRQLFERYPLFKIYGEVYSHNTLSLRTMINAGYTIEGTFKNHRKNLDGTRSDLTRLALDIFQKSRLDEYTNKITNSGFKISPFGENL